jgi:hypothetical protein
MLRVRVGVLLAVLLLSAEAVHVSKTTTEHAARTIAMSRVFSKLIRSFEEKDSKRKDKSSEKLAKVADSQSEISSGSTLEEMKAKVADAKSRAKDIDTRLVCEYPGQENCRLPPCEFEGQENCQKDEGISAEWKAVWGVLGGCLIASFLMCLLAWGNANAMGNHMTLGEFLGSKKMAGAVVGMGSGFVFGFLDNAGLFFGMDMLDPIFSQIPMGKESLVVAGYGNTFSDFVGAFMGTFVGAIIQYEFNTFDYPIWSEGLGVLVGCIFGVYIPRAIHRYIMRKAPKLSLDPEEIAAIIKIAQRRKVDAGEIDFLMSIFDKMDKKMDSKRPGEVSINSIKEHPLFSELWEIFDEADKAGHGDGYLTREEFRKTVMDNAGVQYTPKKLTKDDLKQMTILFQKLLKLKDGAKAVEIEELLKFPSLSHMSKDFNAAAKTKAGELTLDEFNAVMKVHVEEKEERARVVSIPEALRVFKLHKKTTKTEDVKVADLLKLPTFKPMAKEFKAAADGDVEATVDEDMIRTALRAHAKENKTMMYEEALPWEAVEKAFKKLLGHLKKDEATLKEIESTAAWKGLPENVKEELKKDMEAADKDTEFGGNESGAISMSELKAAVKRFNMRHGHVREKYDEDTTD